MPPARVAAGVQTEPDARGDALIVGAGQAAAGGMGRSAEATGSGPSVGLAPLPAAPVLRREVWLVFALSLGAAGLNALLSLVGDLTGGLPLDSQRAVLNGSYAPGRPWLDLAFQLFSLATGIVPVLLVGHLLLRGGGSLRALGLDRRDPRRDATRAAAVAAFVGSIGLGLYLAAHALGANLTVVPSALPAVWWRIPVLLLSAAQNAVLEEVVVGGYLLTRLHQLGWGANRSAVLSACIRGSYHLYQGFGGFLGNLAMGLLFARLYQRWGRVMPLAVAHFLLDAVAFLGYVALHGHVSWLP